MQKKKFNYNNTHASKTFVLHRLLFLGILFLFQVNWLFSQNLPQQNNSISYTLDASVSGVDFYYSIMSCKEKKMVLLKFNNKNNYKVKVSWKEIFTTQTGATIEGASGLKEAILIPGENAEENCEKIIHKNYVTLPEQVNPTYLAHILKFAYKNISVTKI